MNNRILIVDDEQFVLQAQRIYCDSMGFEALEAGSGLEALALFDEHRDTLDATVVDMKLGDMEGLEVVRRMRGADSDVAVVAATGLPSFDMMQSAIRAGVHGFLIKPFHFECFEESVGNAVRCTRDARTRAEQLAGLRELLQHKDEQAEQLANGVIESYLQAIEQFDPSIRTHSASVARYAVLIADSLGLRGREMWDVRNAAYLHDIGKIRVPSRILRKKRSLDRLEWEQMKKHPGAGAQILSRAPCLELLAPAVAHHHERHDGHGYPSGLRGDHIPLHAGIITVADAFEAMTSNRPYRLGMAADHALAVINDHAGSQFHPLAADAFLECMTGRGIRAVC